MVPDFSKPMRQSPWGIAFTAFNFLKAMARAFWPFFLIALVKPNPERIMMTIQSVGIVLVGILVTSIIYHFYYSFWVSDEHLHIQKGWLRRKKVTIPLDRIQSMNMEQTLIHRITGTSGLTMETAGTSGAEGKMGALSIPVAEALRDRIFKTKATLIEGDEVVPESKEIPSENVLFTFDFLDCFLAGLGQNHLRTVGVVFAVAIGFWDDLQPFFKVMPEETLEQAGQVVQSITTLLILAAIGGLAVIIASIIRIILQYADLAVYHDGHRFRIHSGLITIRELAVSGQKLQRVSWSQNPLQRLLRRYQINFNQAVPEEGRGQENVMIPGVNVQQLKSILALVFTEENQKNGVWGRVDAHYFYPRWIWLGLAPGILGSIFLYVNQPAFLILGLVWPLWMAIVSRQYVKRVRWMLNRDLLIVRTGWLVREFTLLPQYKVQGVQLRQSPIQRRWDCYSMDLNTASGEVSIPWMRGEDAHRLRHALLYRIESDDRKWM